MQHALDRFCLNKFTLSWETRVPRKTTFVTFSVLGVVYQTLRALSLWQQESSQQKKERKCENQWEVSLSVLCFHFVDHHLFEWPLCEELHSRWNLAILEYFSRCISSDVWLQMVLRPPALSLSKLCQNHRGRLHLSAEAQRRSKAPVFSVIWLQQHTEYCFSMCSSSRRSRVHLCSCLLFFHRSSEEDLCARARLRTRLILCRRRGWDGDTASALFALKWKGNTTEENRLTESCAGNHYL